MHDQTIEPKWSEAEIEQVARAMFGDEPFDTPATGFYDWAIQTAWEGIAATLAVIQSA